VHYLAVLIGAGATTVNAYLAQESIADRHRRGLFGDLKLRDCVARYKKAVDKGLLKVMSKMGISVLSSYRGGMNFEAIGLSRALVNEFFPGVPSRISGIGLSGIARRVLALHRRPGTRTRSTCRWAASTSCAGAARATPSTAG
jgi:glutamate synthase (NADPH/NADH) large chain